MFSFCCNNQITPTLQCANFLSLNEMLGGSSEDITPYFICRVVPPKTNYLINYRELKLFLPR